MAELVKESAHVLLQREESMRKQAPEHPSAIKDLESVHDSEYGRKKQNDAKGVVSSSLERVTHNVTTTSLCRLRNLQKANPSCRHQSITTSTKKE